MTRLVLKDDVCDLRVKLNCRACQAENISESWVEIKNDESAAVVLDNFASFDPVMKRTEYWLSHFSGS